MKTDELIEKYKKRIHELEDAQTKLKETNEKLLFENSDLKETGKKFQLIADFAHDWEFWLDPQGNFLYISPSVKSITGYSEREFIATPRLLDALLFPEDRASFQDFLSNTLNFTSIGKAFEFRILTRSRQVRWMEIKCRAVYDTDKQYLGQRGSIRDITRLKTALGEITSLEAGKSIETRAKYKYKEDLEYRNREMVSSLLSIAQKNELIQYIRKSLKKIIDDPKMEDNPKLKEIFMTIESHMALEDSWDNFKIHFEQVYPGFFARLSRKHPRLTAKDLRICAYIRLNFNTKEIASLMNITPASAEISRVRLRKKLNLPKGSNLTNFINKS